MARNILIALSAIALLFIGACRQTDTIKPTITSFTISGEDHDVEVYADSAMTIFLGLADNEALKEYKIDIHDGFDGHGHGKLNSFQKFSYQQTFPVAGTSVEETKEISIPANAAAGPYHCIARVLDEAGNEGEFGEIDVMIRNDGQALINVTGPDFSNEVHVNKGDQLTLQGTITDDKDIDEIFVIVGHEEDGHGKLEEEPLYEGLFELTGSADQSWDFSNLNNDNPIIIPTDAETGDYHLEIVVTDSDGNMTIWEGEIHVM